MSFSMGQRKRVIKVGASPDGVAPRPVGVWGQSFGQLLPQQDAPDFPAVDDIEAKLQVLAAAMAEPISEPDALAGTLPPAFTYLGQLIDHDISVSTDSDNEASKIGEGPLARHAHRFDRANNVGAPPPTAASVACGIKLEDL